MKITIEILEKAQAFAENHINTTLSKDQYRIC